MVHILFLAKVKSLVWTEKKSVIKFCKLNEILNFIMWNSKMKYRDYITDMFNLYFD